MRKVVGIAAVLFSVAGASLVLASVSARPGVTLQGGLARAIEIVDATAAGPLGRYETVPMETNSDIRFAGQLRNNHSPVDQTDPDLYPNYKDCDSWRDLINDGWVASHGVEVTLGGEEDPDVAKAAVRAYWEQLGFAVRADYVDRRTSARYDLWVDAGYATYRYYTNRAETVAYVKAFTRCLPPA